MELLATVNGTVSGVGGSSLIAFVPVLLAAVVEISLSSPL